jgi:hypothetical protein
MYAQVKKGMEKKFEQEMKRYSYACDVYKSKSITKWFGLSKPSKEYLKRIGNYTIIMKKNYTMMDFMPDEERHFSKGNHSGLSKEEMLVPLVVIRTK